MSDALVVVKEDTIEQVTVTARPKRQMKITIFDRWCKGCGICSAFCPTQAIEADEEDRPMAAHPERCTNCQMCVLRCPDFAIRVTAQEP